MEAVAPGIIREERCPSIPLRETRPTEWGVNRCNGKVIAGERA